MEGQEGFEPSTRPSAGDCLNRLATDPVINVGLEGFEPTVPGYLSLKRIEGRCILWLMLKTCPHKYPNYATSP